MIKDSSQDRPQHQGPELSDKGRQAEVERHRRQAAALRENLAKRKAQQRSRKPAPPGPDEA